MLSYVNDLSLQEEIVRIQNINLDGILLLATEMRDSQLNAFSNWESLLWYENICGRNHMIV